MALPQYVVRSFAGGAVAAQLLEPMGSTDTSFGITTTTGWTESVGAHIGSALGTSGPFMVVIDRFTDTVEKILCSAVNLTTGVVTVDTTGGSGRGYDGSTAQAHVPGGSTSGVQTGWSAEEAFEANAAVHAILGQSPSANQVLTWISGAPAWVAAAAGVASYAQVTASVSGIVAPTVIVGLTATVTVTAGQTVKLTAWCNAINSGAGLASDQYSLAIFESTTLISQVNLLAGSGGDVVAVLTPSAGAHTYFVEADHLVGSNSGTLVANSQSPAFLLAEVI